MCYSARASFAEGAFISAVGVALLFVSSVKRMYLMGILMLLSLAVAVFFYKVHPTSVWCFFAALISMVILWNLRFNDASVEKMKEVNQGK